MNLQNTTVMSTVERVNIFSDGEDISTVTNYKFLVVLITNDSSTSTVDNSLSSSAVWLQRKAEKRKTDNTLDSKKDECISDQPNYSQAFGHNQ